MIKAVIFDIDGVLLDSFEANLRFFQDLLTYFGYKPPAREEFIPVFHLSLWDTIRVLIKSISDEEAKKIWEAGRRRAVKYHTELLKTPMGAEEVINRLNKNYLLAIVTSRVRASVFESPQLSKLKKHFRVAVSYEDTSNHKPHPEPLLLAAKLLGVRPENAAYVGDAENDIKAAHAAGMKVIIYSKNNLDGADARISDFTKIPDLIKTL